MPPLSFQLLKILKQVVWNKNSNTCLILNFNDATVPQDKQSPIYGKIRFPYIGDFPNVMFYIDVIQNGKAFEFVFCASDNNNASMYNNGERVQMTLTDSLGEDVTIRV